MSKTINLLCLVFVVLIIDGYFYDLTTTAHQNSPSRAIGNRRRNNTVHHYYNHTNVNATTGNYNNNYTIPFNASRPSWNSNNNAIRPNYNLAKPSYLGPQNYTNNNNYYMHGTNNRYNNHSKPYFY